MGRRGESIRCLILFTETRQILFQAIIPLSTRRDFDLNPFGLVLKGGASHAYFEGVFNFGWSNVTFCYREKLILEGKIICSI